MAQRRIKFGIDFETNTSSLRALQNELKSIAHLKATDQQLANPKEVEKLEKAKTAAKELQDILNQSYDIKLNSLDVNKFSERLKASGKTLHDYQLQLGRLGPEGQKAFRNMATELATANTELKKTESFLDNISSTMINAAKWSMAYGAIHKIAEGIQQAYNFTKDLDESLNNIRIVTNKSTDDMEKFARQANAAAAALGRTTKDYTSASLLFYQQGLSDKDVAARTDVTLKAANITGQNAQEVSQQLTAIWNGYKVSAEEAELYIDKVSAVAATTASNLQELAEGMSKVASAANTMGVDIDELNAQLSTIISVTRQDAATAGTALKTIYARMTDIESGLDTETTLGEYTSKMAQFGIQVLDSKGALRDVGDVMNEIGDKWNDFTKTQQVALAQAMAGTRQYNNLMALFGNWDKYTESLKTSQNATGTLQQQNEIYLDSMEAHLNKLQAAKERVYQSLFESDSFIKLLDVLTLLTEQVGKFIDRIGGFLPLLTGLMGPLMMIAHAQIGNAFANMAINADNAKSNANALVEKMEQLSTLKFSAAAGITELDKTIKDAALSAAQLAKQKLITPEEKEEIDKHIRQMTTLTNGYQDLTEAKKKGEAFLGAQFGKDTFSKIENSLYGENVNVDSKVTENINTAVLESKGNITELFEKLEAMDNLAKTLGADFERTFTVLKTINTNENTILDISKFANKDKNADSFLEELMGKDADVSAALKEIESVNKEEADKLRELWKNTFDDIWESIETDKAGDLTQKSLNKINISLESFKNKATNATRTSTEAFTAFANALTGQSKKVQQEFDNEKKALELRAIRYRQNAQEIVKNISKITMLVSAITQVVNVTKIWADEDKSLGEKLLTLGQTLLTLLPLLASSGVLTKILTFSETALAGSAKGAAGETAKQGAAAVVAGIQSALGAEGVKKLGNAFGKLALKALPIVGLMLTIGAAIAAIAVIVKVASDNIHRQERETQKVIEALGKAKNVQKELADEYDRFKEQISVYEELQDKINGLVAGTEEWTKAVEENNNKVYELIDTYKELAQYIDWNKYNATGVLTLTESGIQAVESTKQKALNNAKMSTAAAQLQNSQNQNLNTAQQVAKNTNYKEGWRTAGNIGAGVGGAAAGEVVGAAGGAAVGAGTALGFAASAIAAGTASGAAVAGVGAIVGAVIGAIVGIVGGAIMAATAADAEQIHNHGREVQKAMEALTKVEDARTLLMQKSVNEISAQLGVSEQTAKYLKNNYKEIVDNLPKIKESLAARDAWSIQAVNAYNQQYGGYEYKNAKAEIKTLTDKALAEAIVKAMEDQDLSKIKINDSDFKDYALANGFEWNEEKKKAYKVNENGEISYFEKDDYKPLIQAWKAEQEALKENSKAIKAEKLSTFKNLNTKQLQALNLFAGGKDTALLDFLSGEELEDFLGVIHQLNDEGRLTNDVLHALGYEGDDAIKKFFDALENGENSARERYQKIQEQITERITDEDKRNTFVSLQKNELKSLSLTEQQVIADAFEKASPELVNQFNDLLKSSPEQAADIAQAFAAVDWQDLDGFNQFRDQLNAFGVDITNITDKIETVGKAFQDLLNDPENWDISKIQAFAGAIKELQGLKYEKYGTYKEEEVSHLKTTLGDSFEDYFRKNDNGTYTLTKSRQSLIDEIQTRHDSIVSGISAQDVANRQDFNNNIETKRVEATSEARRQYRETYKNTFASEELKRYSKGTYYGTTIYSLPTSTISSLKEFINKELIGQGYQNFPANLLEWLNDGAKETSVKNLKKDYKKLVTEISKGKEWVANNMVAEVNEQEELTQEEFDLINTKLDDPLLTETDLQNYEDIANQLSDNSLYKEPLLTKISKVKKSFETKKEELSWLKDIKIQGAKEEEINKILASRQTLLSKLQKFYETFAMSSEEQLENLRKQEELLKEQPNLIQNKINNKRKEISFAPTVYDFENDILELYNNLDLTNYSSIYSSLWDAVANNPIYNFNRDKIEERFNELIGVFQDKLIKLADIESLELEKYNSMVEAAKVTVQTLIGITKNDQRLWDFTKTNNDFARKLAEKSKDYSLIGDAYQTDYTFANDQYLRHANAVTELQKKINTLKAKAVLNAQESAELEQAELSIITETKNMQDSLLSALESAQKVEETRLDLGKQITEQYSQQIKNAENQISILNHQIKLYKILNGETAYAGQASYYTGITAQNEKEVQEAQNKYEAALSTYKALENSTDVQMKQNALNELTEAGKEVLTKVESLLEAAKQKFEINMKAALDEFFKLTQVAQDISDYNWQYDFDTNHMSGLTRDLQLSNLGIKYQKAINQYATDESAQKRLLSVYQEVNKVLEKKETITKNDIALAEKRLALEQARIDLENAQNDTSKMKLVRGANGEYTYQYMADENNILDKMTAYNTAELNYQEQLRSSLKDTTAEVTKLIELYQKLATATTEDERNTILSEIEDAIRGIKDASLGLDLSPLNDELENFIKSIQNGTLDMTGFIAKMNELVNGYNNAVETGKKASGEVTEGKGGAEGLSYYLGLSDAAAGKLAEKLTSMTDAFDGDNGLIAKAQEFVKKLQKADGPIGKLNKTLEDIKTSLSTPIPGLGLSLVDSDNFEWVDADELIDKEFMTSMFQKMSQRGKKELTEEELEELKKYVEAAKAAGIDINPSAWEDLFDKNNSISDINFKRLYMVVTNLKNNILNAISGSMQANEDMIEASGSVGNYIIENIDLPGITSMQELLDGLRDLFNL